MTTGADLELRGERRDLRARGLRDHLATRLECHPRRLGGLSAEVVAAMLERLDGGDEADVRRRLREECPSVVTPVWDSRTG